jgi:hypothetical protein
MVPIIDSRPLRVVPGCARPPAVPFFDGRDKVASSPSLPYFSAASRTTNALWVIPIRFLSESAAALYLPMMDARMRPRGSSSAVLGSQA